MSKEKGGGDPGQTYLQKNTIYGTDRRQDLQDKLPMRGQRAEHAVTCTTDYKGQNGFRQGEAKLGRNSEEPTPDALTTPVQENHMGALVWWLSNLSMHQDHLEASSNPHWRALPQNFQFTRYQVMLMPPENTTLRILALSKGIQDFL